MTTLTRELERTRNGAKIMERTLEAAKVDIARLREDYADSQDRIKALENALNDLLSACMFNRNKSEPMKRAAALLEKK